MKVSDIVRVLEGNVLTGQELLDTEIHSACGADLMSDVMAFVKEHVVLLTGLVNQQAIRTAEMMDIRVIVFVRGKTPTPEMVEEAAGNGMTLITTKYSMFLACGRLYEAGIRTGGMRESC